MKIAIITDTFVPEINGVARALEQYAIGLANRKHEVVVVRPRREKESKKEQEKDGLYREIILPSFPLPQYKEIRFGVPLKKSLDKVFKDFKPDIVYVSTETILGITAIEIAKLKNIKIITGYHTNFAQYKYGLDLFEYATTGYLKWFHDKADLTIVPSKDTKTYFEKNGFGRVVQIEYGVDVKFFDPNKRSNALRKKWGADENTIVALFVGRITNEKNIPLSLDAIREAKKKRANMIGVVVGDGPSREKLESQYGDFIFTGAKSGEELAQCYASADLFVFSSITETFGQTVSESMASGLVFVGYNYAGVKERIVNGKNGFAVPFNDSEKFIETVIDVVVNKWPCENIRKQAREDMEKCTWDAVVDRLEQTIINVCKRDKKEPSKIQKIIKILIGK